MITRKPFNFTIVMEPILLHLLDGEIDDPKAFYDNCKATVGELYIKAKDKFPEDFLRFIGLPIWTYINLKKELGQQKAFEIMRIAFITGGYAIQSILFDPVQYPRSFNMFCDRELFINQNGSTKWNKLEPKERTDNKFEFTITRCMYHELNEFLGIPEATPMICSVDNALFNSYLPEEMVFHRGGLNRKIANGSKDGCHFVWEYCKE